jgi:PAS domain S-box-containing protein
MSQPGEASLSSRGGTTPVTTARILVVEDGIIMARDIERRLTTMGYRVVGTAGTGEEAIRKARDVQPDLILMDVNLRGAIDGIAAAEQIRKNADVPIIYVTAYSDDATLHRARSTEPFGYVLKPFEERELRTTIEIALCRHGVDKDLRENEKRYRAIAEVSPGFAYSVAVRPDGSLNTEWVTDGFTNTGLTVDDLSNLSQHVHPDDNRTMKERMRHLLAGEHDVAEYRIVAKDGESRWWLDHARPLWDEARQRIVRILGAAQDITERKRAEQHAETMRSAQKAVEREVKSHLHDYTRTISSYVDVLNSIKGMSTATNGSSLSSRLQRILRVYERVYDAEHPETIEKFLRTTTAETFKRLSTTRLTYTVQTDQVGLSAEKTAGLLILLQEILDAMLGQGSGESVKGQILVELRKQNDKLVALRVVRDGGAVRKEALTRPSKACGGVLLEHVLKLLEGTLTCDKGQSTQTVAVFPAQ